MGSRKSWGCGCLGCGVLWIAFAVIGMLAFQSLRATSSPTSHDPWALWTFLPAMLPIGIGCALLMAEYAATAPHRRQQSVDRVATALTEHGGVTPEQIAEELDLSCKFTRQAIDELIADGRLVGFVDSAGRIHAMDPLQVRPGRCPACEARLDADRAGVICPECGSRVLRPGGGEEAG